MGTGAGVLIHPAIYPPVVTFALAQTSPRLIGYAAPKNGTKPCVLKLTADDTPIAFIRASRFSAEAFDAGLRLGWCGFEIPGLAQAFAIGSRVELACAGSGAILATIPVSTAVFAARAGEVERLSAAEVIVASRSGETCEHLDQLLPFAAHHRQKFGPRAVVEATFQTVLGRWPEHDLVDRWSRSIGDDAELIAFIDEITDSPEYRKDPLRSLPGPFHQAFRYDLGPLG